MQSDEIINKKIREATAVFDILYMFFLSANNTRNECQVEHIALWDTVCCSILHYYVYILHILVNVIGHLVILCYR